MENLRNFQKFCLDSVFRVFSVSSHLVSPADPKPNPWPDFFVLPVRPIRPDHLISKWPINPLRGISTCRAKGEASTKQNIEIEDKMLLLNVLIYYQLNPLKIILIRFIKIMAVHLQ